RIVVMRAGQVEQVGTPEEIYARPASLFVADFAGHVNAVACRSVDRGNGRVSVETSNHRITVASDIAATEVLVLVRPEAVRLGPAGSDGLGGVVEKNEKRAERAQEPDSVR